MNYLTDDRRNALAADYVLGTLQGKARIRFQKLLMQHSSLRTTVWRWERGLNGLGESLPSQAVPVRVWERIQRRIGAPLDSTLPNDSSRDDKPKRQVLPLGVETRFDPWRWLAGSSTAAALFLAVVLIWPVMYPDSPEQLVVVQSEKAQPLWLIEWTDSTFNVQATDRLVAQADKDYELWLVAADGRDPVSLGLLPKQGQRQLPRIALLDEVDINVLAVSLEPLGGSPTGKPTTVLYTAEPVNI